MTVRHIVTWKMNGETAEERASQADEAVAKLRTLEGNVPGIVALNVYRNEYNTDANWDVTLMSDHDDKAALDAYAVDPFHVEVASYVKERVASRACVDFEL